MTVPARPSNALIPELVVADWVRSRNFYCDLLGFATVYRREEEGFAFLALGDAQLMICQMNAGRMFDGGHLPRDPPFGRGLNLQIRAPDLPGMIAKLEDAGVSLFLPLEEKWYRRADDAVGQRQFVVADPDGYLLRFFQEIGTR